MLVRYITAFRVLGGGFEKAGKCQEILAAPAYEKWENQDHQTLSLQTKKTKACACSDKWQLNSTQSALPYSTPSSSLKVRTRT